MMAWIACKRVREIDRIMFGPPLGRAASNALPRHRTVQGSLDRRRLVQMRRAVLPVSQVESACRRGNRAGPRIDVARYVVDKCRDCKHRDAAAGACPDLRTIDQPAGQGHLPKARRLFQRFDGIRSRGCLNCAEKLLAEDLRRSFRAMQSCRCDSNEPGHSNEPGRHFVTLISEASQLCWLSLALERRPKREEAEGHPA